MLTLFLLTTVFITGWSEYHTNDNVTIGIFNATDGSAITTGVCNMSVTQNGISMLSYSPMLSETGDGYYTWTVAGLVASPEDKNLGKVNCSVAGNQWHTSGEFFVVDDYTVNTSASAPENVWAWGNRTLTEIGNSILTDIGTAVWSSATRTLSSFGSLIADIWNSAPDIPAWVWNFTEGRNATTVSITNDTQEFLMENASVNSGVGALTTYDNSTINIILPAEAI